MAGLEAMFAKYDRAAEGVAGGDDAMVRELVKDAKNDVSRFSAAADPSPLPSPGASPAKHGDLDADSDGAPQLDMSEEEIQKMLAEYEALKGDDEWVKNPYYIPLDGEEEEGAGSDEGRDVDDDTADGEDAPPSSGVPRVAIEAGWEEILERENEELRRRRQVENEEIEWEVNGEMRVLFGLELTPGGLVPTADRRARDHPASAPAITVQGNPVHAVRKRSLHVARKKKTDPDANNESGTDNDTSARRTRAKDGGDTREGFLITEVDAERDEQYDSHEEATVHDALASIHANDVKLEFPGGVDSDSSDNAAEYTHIALPPHLKAPPHLPPDKAAAWERDEQRRMHRQRKLESRRRQVEADTLAFKQTLVEKGEARTKKTAATKSAKALQHHLEKQREREEGKRTADDERRYRDSQARKERLAQNEERFLKAQERNLQRERAKASKYDEERQQQLAEEERRHNERVERYTQLKSDARVREERAEQRKVSLQFRGDTARRAEEERRAEEKAREARRQDVRAKVYTSAGAGVSPSSDGSAVGRRKPNEGYDGRRSTPLTHASKPRAIPTPEKRGEETGGGYEAKKSYHELHREKVERDERRRVDRERKEEQLREQVLRDDGERQAKDARERAARQRRDEDARQRRQQAVQDMKAAALRREEEQLRAADDERVRKERFREQAAKQRRKVLAAGNT